MIRFIMTKRKPIKATWDLQDQRITAGGIEGGMTNGMPIVVRGTMKPISTLLQGMDSVDLLTGESARSDYERSDVCALPAASVVNGKCCGI